MKILVKTMGFIGDNIFATPIAKKLKEKHGNDCVVDFHISILAPFELIHNSPYIDNVYTSAPDEDGYDIVHRLNPIHRKETPIIQLQKQCGIENPTTDYEVYTNSAIDSLVSAAFIEHRKNNKLLLAFQLNWEEKTFIFTEEEYKKGIDVPGKGYGGKHRNIDFILNELNKNPNFILIPVGKPNGYDQRVTDVTCVSELTLTASVIKECDCFIGTEGGLSNIAAGVGTKTILTGDFVHQLYGWNGVIEKNEDPKLGPIFYFPEFGHVTLNPYITDREVVDSINKHLIP
jgi:hypothetical protein